MSADRVNEFDSDAWGSVFDAMTKEREESESAEAVSARQAAEMVTKMLEDMQEKFVGALDKMEGDRECSTVSCMTECSDLLIRAIIGSGRVP